MNLGTHDDHFLSISLPGKFYRNNIAFDKNDGDTRMAVKSESTYILSQKILKPQ